MKKVPLVMSMVVATAHLAQAYGPEQLLIGNVTGSASDTTHGAFGNLVNGAGLVNWT